MNEDIITKEKKVPKKPVRKPEAVNPATVEKVDTDQLKSASEEAMVELAVLKDTGPIDQVQESEDNTPIDQEKELEDAVDKKKDKKNKSEKKIRTLCKLVKRDYLKKHFQEFQELVLDPLFICRKCGRVAKEKQYLCRPFMIEKENQDHDAEAIEGLSQNLSNL